MTERQLKLALTDDDWRALDAILQALKDNPELGPELGPCVPRGLTPRVHAIKVAINTRHYNPR